MATPTTTYDAVCEQWIEVVEALTPARLAQRFERAPVWIAEDFEQAAAEDPGAFLRRFWIEYQGRVEPPPVNDGSVEQHTVEAELRVAYPREYAGYGADAKRRGEIDLEFLMATDAEQIVRAIGVSGAANYVSAQMWCRASWRKETLGRVSFAVLELETTYYASSEESMPATVQTSAFQAFSRETTTSSDELAVTFPLPMHDTSYNLDAAIEELGYEGVICRLKAGTATTVGCTIAFSATIPSGQTVAITVRDRS